MSKLRGFIYDVEPDLLDSALPSFGVSVKYYGAKGDVIRLTTGAMTAGSPALGLAGASFSILDIGKRVVVQGAGQEGATYYSTISSITNSTTAVCADNALTTVTNATTNYGTDDTNAFNRALAASRTIVIPKATFMVRPVLSNMLEAQQIVGEARSGSLIYLATPLNNNGLFNGINRNGISISNIKVDGGNLIGTKNALFNFFGCTGARLVCNDMLNVHRFAIALNSMNYATIADNYIVHKQRVGLYVKAFVPGAGGPANATGLVATVTGGTAIETPICKYNTDGAGAVSAIYFDNNGEYTYTSAVPTISFPAVPGASCTEAIGGTQVTAITVASTTTIGNALKIYNNIIFRGNINLSVKSSFVYSNYVEGNLYGGGIVLDTNTAAAQNIVANNIVSYCGFNATTSLYSGQDTDNATGVGIESYTIRAIIIGNICFGCAGDGIDSGGQTSVVSGNICFNNGGLGLQEGGPYVAGGITLRYVTSDVNASGTTVADNNCFNTTGASGPQAFGIVLESSSVAGVTLRDNVNTGHRTASYNLNGATLASFRGVSLTKIATVDVPNILAGTVGTEITVSLPGLEAASKWVVSISQEKSSALGIVLNAYAKSANTVGVYPVNARTVASDPVSDTWYIRAEEVL